MPSLRRWRTRRARSYCSASCCEPNAEKAEVDVNHLQSPPATHHQPPGGEYVGMRPGHGARLHHGWVAAKWSLFRNQCESEFLRAARGRGFISLERSRPATAPTLMRRFFFWPKLLIFFKRNQVFQTLDSKFLQRNKADRSGWLPLSSIYFPTGRWAIAPEKLSRNYRGGGGTS